LSKFVTKQAKRLNNGRATTSLKTSGKVSKPGKNPILEFTGKAGKYKVMVKVVDTLGTDTSKVIEVHIK
jgi:hypothetical protein